MNPLITIMVLLGLLAIGSPVHADLCNDVLGTVRPVTPEVIAEIAYYPELFPDPDLQGSLRWDEIILQCNRQRDSKGREVARALGSERDTAEKALLKARDLETKVIRGHYDFVGLPIGSLLSFKYVYALSKKDGIWTMTIPYRPQFHELVPNRVDFNFTHARTLFDSSQVEPASAAVQIVRLKAGAQPISVTQCATTTYFPGEHGAYADKELHQRDPENEAISLGKIEYRYGKNGNAYAGCRVDKNKDLYWKWDTAGSQAVKVKPQDWILDNFIRTSETYWSIPGVFELKLYLKGHNDANIPASLRSLFEHDDHLTVNFATKFLRAHFNQMYKSNVFQVNNFSTMTTDGSYWHEVGHAFGLDDEYGFVDAEDGRKSCRHEHFTNLYPTSDYQMCEGGADEKRTIYHYLAVSRYITKQKECNHDNDCGSGEFCNAGLDLKKNQCMAKKADNETCDIAGGDHQCKSGHCKLSRCYSPNSVPMGETCYLNDACKEGKCSSLDGTKGTCVCQADADCGSGKYCNAGLDATKNSCLALKNDNETCDIAGGGHQCKSGFCKFSRCYTPNSVEMGDTCYSDDACKEGKCSAVDGAKGTCVCKADSDCATGKYCDAGLDTKVNACRPKLGKGEKCGSVTAPFGNDHKCKSGECSGAPFYKCK
jgi:hypothetical protein